MWKTKINTTKTVRTYFSNHTNYFQITAIITVISKTKTAINAIKTSDSFVPAGTDAIVAETRNSRNDNADKKAKDVNMTRFSTRSTLTLLIILSTTSGICF
jgi:vacuolar-type H+-ATPase subunit C/Vma6